MGFCFLPFFPAMIRGHGFSRWEEKGSGVFNRLRRKGGQVLQSYIVVMQDPTPYDSRKILEIT